MEHLRKYLVLLRNDEASHVALNYALAFAKATNASLEILFEPKPEEVQKSMLLYELSPNSTAMSMEDVIKLSAKATFDNELSDLEDTNQSPAIKVDLWGRIKKAQLNNDSTYDLLIVPSVINHGSLLPRWMLGTPTDLVSETQIPVLFVPEDAKYEDIRSVVVNFEEDRRNQFLFNKLTWLFRDRKPTYRVINVISDRNDRLANPKILRQATNSLLFPFTMHTMYGKKEVALENASIKMNAQLIAILTKGLHSWQHFFVSDPAESLVANGKVPVLVVNKPTVPQVEKSTSAVAHKQFSKTSIA